jgi:hypothetical protein
VPWARTVVSVSSTTPAPDYYRVLGVSRGAKLSEIKAAWRTKAVGAHPDRGGSEAAFKELHAAYETLRDTSRRLAYDEELLYKEQVRSHSSTTGATTTGATTTTGAPGSRAYVPPQSRGSGGGPSAGRGKRARATVAARRASERDVRVTWRGVLPRSVEQVAPLTIVIVGVAWVSWWCNRIGIEHIKSFAVDLGIAHAPSVSAQAIGVTLCWALGASLLIRRLARFARSGGDFVSWCAGGLFALYVLPLAWNGVVQSVSGGLLVGGLLYYVIGRGSAGKALAHIKRPK